MIVRNQTSKSDHPQCKALRLFLSAAKQTAFNRNFTHTGYDAAGRLTDEVFTDVGNLLSTADSYHATYTHDLTGNRLKKTVDTGNNGSVDESLVYTFDANDRMLTESLDTGNNGSVEQTTTYGYT